MVVAFPWWCDVIDPSVSFRSAVAVCLFVTVRGCRNQCWRCLHVVVAICARFSFPFLLLFVFHATKSTATLPLTVAGFSFSRPPGFGWDGADGTELRRRRCFDAGGRRQGARAVGDGEAGRSLCGKERWVRRRAPSLCVTPPSYTCPRMTRVPQRADG